MAAAPEPVADEPKTGGRSSRKILLVVVAVVVVIAGASAAVLLRDADAEPVEDAASTVATNAPDPGLRVPESPVALVADTEYVETEVLPDGDLRVQHWLRTAQPVQQLSLAPGGDGYTGADITDLVVAADGVPAASADLVASSGWSSPVPETDMLYVSYRLSGVLQASDSAQGRGLVTTTALALDVGRDLLSRTQSFRGSAVLTLACLPPGRESMPRPCGSQSDATWSVVNQGGDIDDSVIAQVDLGAQP